jgi:DNA-binding beta-propeller fold protein YncE
LFNTENNTESLQLDRELNRLLIAPKDRDPNSKASKGIYAFSLDSKKIVPEPLFRIDMGDEVFTRFREKESYKTFRPSDLAIHPLTKEIYVLEGSNPKLLILDAKGNAKKVYAIDKKIIPQPEGIAFDPDGTLYICSEGTKDGKGTITELQLDQ